MTIKERFIQLKNEWIATKDEAARKAIDEKINALADENPEEFECVFVELLKDTRDRAARLRSEETHEALEPIYKVLNWAYVADTYFGKTRSWFSNKLNGAIVNGKPAYFKREELNILADALRDISKKLEDVANNIHS